MDEVLVLCSDGGDVLLDFLAPAEACGIVPGPRGQAREVEHCRAGPVYSLKQQKQKVRNTLIRIV